MTSYASEPARNEKSKDEIPRKFRAEESRYRPSPLEYMRDLALELQRLAEKSGCAELAALLARAAAEAHHQAEARKL